MKPVGVYLLDDSGEAQELRHLCSQGCAEAYVQEENLNAFIGPNNEALPGTKCDRCGISILDERYIRKGA